MKDRLARVLAIIALVTMALFLAALITALVDHTLLSGSIGFIALGLGVFTFMIFIALKADGRGFSMTKINNEIEMKKIEDELAEKEKAEKADSDDSENSAEADGTEQSDSCAEAGEEIERDTSSAKADKDGE